VAHALNCSGYSYILTNGQVADANQVMANFNTIMNCANNVLATQASLSGYAPIASPIFTGVPTAPTGTVGDTSLQIATDAFAATAALNASNVHGLQSAGQLTISGNTTLGNSQLGANLLLNGSFTLTFPSATGTYWLNNVGASAVTLSFPGGTDFRTTLNPGEQVGLAGDGGGFWRIVAAGVPLYGVTQSPGDNTTKVATTAFVAAAAPAATTSTAGVVPLATAAQFAAGTDATHALTPAAEASGQTLAATGATTLAGGVQLEWGTSGSITNGGSATQTLAHACAATVYSITITPVGAGGSGGQSYAYVTVISLSQFTITNQASAPLSFYWQVICK